jgi:hypothetical protein
VFTFDKNQCSRCIRLGVHDGCEYAPNTPFLQRDLKLGVKVKEEPVHVSVSQNDVVIFKQLLLHRSTQNFSTQVRWTGQIRMTDISVDDYKEQGFPTGDKTNIFYVDYPGFKYNQHENNNA